MSCSVDSLYLDPERYDLIYGEYADIPRWFYQSIPEKGDLLELACGTGRWLIPIAEQGIEVWGIDNSSPMLDQCRVKAEKAGVDIPLFPDDMRAFHLNNEFSVIILVSNTVWHLLSRDDAVQCFMCVREHMKPDSLFMIGVFVPDPEILSRDPYTRYPYGDYTDPRTGRRVHITHTAVYDEDTQIRQLKCFEGDSSEVIAELNLRMYFPEELDELLEQSGFIIENKYGSWDRDSFHSDSGLQLIFCRTD